MQVARCAAQQRVQHAQRGGLPELFDLVQRQQARSAVTLEGVQQQVDTVDGVAVGRALAAIRRCARGTRVGRGRERRQCGAGTIGPDGSPTLTRRRPPRSRARRRRSRASAGCRQQCASTTVLPNPPGATTIVRLWSRPSQRRSRAGRLMYPETGSGTCTRCVASHSPSAGPPLAASGVGAPSTARPAPPPTPPPRAARCPRPARSLEYPFSPLLDILSLLDHTTTVGQPSDTTPRSGIRAASPGHDAARIGCRVLRIETRRQPTLLTQHNPRGHAVSTGAHGWRGTKVAIHVAAARRRGRTSAGRRAGAAGPAALAAADPQVANAGEFGGAAFRTARCRQRRPASRRVRLRRTTRIGPRETPPGWCNGGSDREAKDGWQRRRGGARRSSSGVGYGCWLGHSGWLGRALPARTSTAPAQRLERPPRRSGGLYSRGSLTKGTGRYHAKKGNCPYPI